MKNNLYSYLTIISFFLVGITAVSAQNVNINSDVYDLEEDGETYKITSYIETMTNYNPPWAKNHKGGPIMSALLNVTHGYIETDNTEVYYKGGMKLHIYAPTVKTGKNAFDEPLPVIVYGYGGGFLSPWSEKENKTIPQWLAKRGYIVIAPEYRLGMCMYQEELARRAIWRALQDIRVINRYARTINDVNYSSDQTKPLTYVGWSSGAFIGLHNLYLNDVNRPEPTKHGFNFQYRQRKFKRKELGRPGYTYNWYDGQTYDLGGLDTPFMGTSSQPVASAENPVPDITVSISGAIGDLSWTHDVTNRPKALFMLHHSKDAVVPFGTGEAYKGFLLFGTKGDWKFPVVNGSSAINSELTTYSNSLLVPDIYKFSEVKPDCDNDDCLEGDAGGKYGPKNIPDWWHDPTEYANNQVVMNSILSFIETSTATLTNGVANRSLTTVQEPLLIEPPVHIEEALIVYPNPAKDKFSIEIGDYEKAYKLEGYDFTGNLLLTEKIKNSTTDVYTVDSSKLIPGLYVFKLYTNSGIKTAKVMIE
ncbi:MAG: T9SS type A sorting domain-containing protein [Kordia sp.]|uniref:T9SS type A sorting domain-containing protein n=1 Tax=Kordia sp. TaxID=1965332 RepID=UPI00385AC730